MYARHTGIYFRDRGGKAERKDIDKFKKLVDTAWKTGRSNAERELKPGMGWFVVGRSDFGWLSSIWRLFLFYEVLSLAFEGGMKMGMACTDQKMIVISGHRKLLTYSISLMILK